MIGWFFLIPAIAMGQTAPDSPFSITSDQQTSDPEVNSQLQTGTQATEEECWSLLEQLRQALLKAKQAQFGYTYGTYEQSDEFYAQWQEAVTKGSKLRLKLGDCVGQWLLSVEPAESELTQLARTIIGPLFDDYQYEMTFLMADRLSELYPEEKDVLFMKARSALITNRFEEAARLRDLIGDLLEHLDETEIEFFKGLPKFQSLWREEQKIRQAEELADDLPRVEITTTEGSFVVELFENEYPETVANFISLVEQGFYDNQVFHRVTKNFLPTSNAETGAFVAAKKPDGNILGLAPRSPGYRIYDEQSTGKIRPHFRGTISMIREFDPQGNRIPNSISSRIFIPLVPATLLDSRHLVIGRVIENIEIIDRLQPNVKMDPQEGTETLLDNPGLSEIISARVIRKRDREYSPNIVKE